MIRTLAFKTRHVTLTGFIATFTLLGCRPSEPEQAHETFGRDFQTTSVSDAFVVMSNQLSTPKIYFAPPESSNAWVDARNSQRAKAPTVLVFQNSDEPRAQKITCVNNLKQIGLCFRQWVLDNEDKFPFNVSTTAGGTMEFCAQGSDGFDRNAVRHFKVMSNELNTPKLLICPQDKARKPAVDFVSLQAANVTYQLRSGTNISEANPREILVVCPIDGNILYCDGTVKEAKK